MKKIGWLVAFFMLIFYSMIFVQLLQFNVTLTIEPYLWRILWFSFWQAGISALLSIVLAIPIARALYYLNFPFKALLIRLFSLTYVLPTLVVVFGIIGVYGANGWLNIGKIYGLKGILLAHIFFNVPLASKIFWQTLESIPTQQHQLAAQLNLSRWIFFWIIELPLLKQQIKSLWALIFMLCFTSFTIVLTLGGGPKFATLEVALYQAINFEFNLPKAAVLALFQLFCCLTLFFLTQSKILVPPIERRVTWRLECSLGERLFLIAILSGIVIFLGLPLLHTILAGAKVEFITAWRRAILWYAMMFSLGVAFLAAIFALILALPLIYVAREMSRPQWFLSLGMVNLAVPTTVLAIGLFLWFRDAKTWQLFVIVALCNALSALPFVIRTLYLPFQQNFTNYQRLCLQLNLIGWQRWKIVEFPLIRKQFKQALAFAAALSLGDFTAIALFGNKDFLSLPYLLYQQLGHYRSYDAAATALILLLLTLLLFVVIEERECQ